MRKQTLLAILAAGLVSLVALSACTTEPGTGDGTSADPSIGLEETDAEASSGTTADTTAETDPASTETDTAVPAETKDPAETETRAPRYDYMAADVAPNVTLDKSAYSDIRLTLPSTLLVTDADVAAYIDYIRFDYRTPDNGTTEMKDQPMKLGDDAFIYYKGVMDGEEFEGGSNWDADDPYQLGLGSGSFIPGFEEGLIGVVPANATREHPAEVKVTFPADYGNELAGKDAIFYVAVTHAVQYTLPTYDRAFVETTLKYEGKKDFYASDRAYLEEFEDYVRTYLESRQAEAVESAKLEALWNHLVETAECQNLPQLELDYYFGAYMDEIEYYYEYYKSYGGTSFTETYPTMDAFACSYVGVDAGGDWKAELTKSCERLVKKDMILHAIAEREGIEVVTEEEYKAELKSLVDYYQGYMSEAEILESMGEEAIRESAFAAKMQKWLLDHTTYTYETAAR